MLEEQDLVGSLELTCRGSTWLRLGLGSLDIQAPRLPCLQPRDQSRFGEWPHCRGEGEGTGWRVDESHRTSLKDPRRPGVVGGGRERPERQVEEAKAGDPASHL